jgi:hypothetical protein
MPPRHISPATLFALVAGFLLLRAVFFAFTTAGEYDLYKRYADVVRESSLSELYRTQDIEYPPLAVLFGVPPGYLADVLPAGAERLVDWRPNDVIGGEAGARYEVALGIVLFAVDLACLALVFLIARRIYPTEGSGKRIIRLVIYVAATSASGVILYDRQDLVVGLVPLLAIVAFLRGWSGTAYAILTLGVAYKLVPLLLFPLWVFAFAANRSGPTSTRDFVFSAMTKLLFPLRVLAFELSRSAASRSAGSRSAPTNTRDFLIAVAKESLVAGLILAAYPVISYLLWGDRSFLYLTFHSARGLQLEAPVTWLVFLFDPATEVGFGYCSHTLRGALSDRTAVAASLAMMVVAVLSVIVCGRGFWRAATAAQPPNRNELATHLVTGSLLMWIGFILFNKVGSPQYLLWVAPLVPLMTLRGSNWWCAAVLVLSMVCTTLIYPCCYPVVRGDFTDDPETWTGPTVGGLFLLFAKSLTLTVGFVWLAVSVWRNKLGESRG